VAYFGEANKIKKLLESSAWKMGVAMAMAYDFKEEENADRLETKSASADHSLEALAALIVSDGGAMDPNQGQKSICGAKFELLFKGLVNVCNIRQAIFHTRVYKNCVPQD
jgi:hypothetical protein